MLHRFGQSATNAIQMLEERMKLGAPEVHSVAILGMAYFTGGDYPRAEELERQAIGIDAKYPLAWLGLGKALGAEKKTDDAEKAYRPGARAAPALTDASLNRADILVQRGKLDEAAAACEAALKAMPDTPNTLLEAGRDSHAARAIRREPATVGASAEVGSVHASAEGAAGGLLFSEWSKGTGE